MTDVYFWSITSANVPYPEVRPYGAPRHCIHICGIVSTAVHHLLRKTVTFTNLQCTLKLVQLHRGSSLKGWNRIEFQTEKFEMIGGLVWQNPQNPSL